MSPPLLYFDSSAIVKLVRPEPETAALVRMIRSSRPDAISSLVARVEVLRALLRLSARQPAIRRATDALGRIALLPLDEPVIRTAATLPPPKLRTLDALHLATALSVGEGLDGMVTYDSRLAAAAAAAGVEVLAPR